MGFGTCPRRPIMRQLPTRAVIPPIVPLPLPALPNLPAISFCLSRAAAHGAHGENHPPRLRTNNRT